MLLGVVTYINKSDNSLTIDVLIKEKKLRKIEQVCLDDFQPGELVWIENKGDKFYIRKVLESEMININFYYKLSQLIKLEEKKLNKEKSFLIDGIINPQYNINIDTNTLIANKESLIKKMLDILNYIKNKINSTENRQSFSTCISFCEKVKFNNVDYNLWFGFAKLYKLGKYIGVNDELLNNLLDALLSANVDADESNLENLNEIKSLLATEKIKKLV